MVEKREKVKWFLKVNRMIFSNFGVTFQSIDVVNIVHCKIQTQKE